jgi:hypothetical protein
MMALRRREQGLELLTVSLYPSGINYKYLGLPPQKQAQARHGCWV